MAARFHNLVLFTLLGFPALALDPAEPASSYIRANYTVEDGLLSNVVNTLIQTRNGFLWIGTDAGLARFNGRQFHPVNIRGPRATSQGVVRALAESPEGDLWVGTNTGLARIPSVGIDPFVRSQATFYHPGTGLSDEITCLKFTRNGTFLIGTDQGLFRREKDRFVLAIPKIGVTEIEEAADGRILIIANGRFYQWNGVKLSENANLAADLGVRPDGFLDVAEDQHGALWFCSGAGLARVLGNSIQRIEPYGKGDVGALQANVDSQHNVWISTQKGIFRLSGNALEPLLLGQPARLVYPDREGSLWVGTNGAGLVRFKDRTARMFTAADGLPNNVPMTVLTRRDGSLWVGNNCGGLSVLEGSRFRTYREKDGLSNSCVWSLAEDSAGTLWIGTWGGGLFRFKDSRFTQYSVEQGLAGSIALSVIVAKDGSLWIATLEGVSHMRDGRFRNYGTADGLSSNRVVTVYQDRHGSIWAGTSKGIDRMVGDRFTPLSSEQEIFDPRYIALGEDPAGDLYAFSAPKGISRVEGDRLVNINSDLDVLSMAPFTPPGGPHELWFSGGTGIFRLPSTELRELMQDRQLPLDYATYGRADGLTSTQCSIGSPNMSVTREGKLWVATVQGLALFDLPRLPRANRKPALFVEEVTVGREKSQPLDQLVLPPGTQHVELKFDSIVFASPEKIRFQYRMDDVDSDWLDADITRTAIYTSIPVGTHAFHVRACNNDGIWDREGIVYRVTQQPYFYETVLFRITVVLLAIGIVFGIYQLRLRQIAARLNARLEERVAERTRLARELHDTLLQTIQGSKLVAEHALEDPSDAKVMRHALERLSVWLAQATQEGRAALNSLRMPVVQGNDLSEAFHRAGEECLVTGSMEYVLSVEGTAKEMHPIVRDEVYRIGYEAIRNACTHSQGNRLEVDLAYAHELTLRVRDNGKGIDAEVAARGREGHFGLKGMQERATRIGGKLRLFSSPGTGTEMELIVPGGIAFTELASSASGVLARLRRIVNRNGGRPSRG